LPFPQFSRAFCCALRCGRGVESVASAPPPAAAWPFRASVGCAESASPAASSSFPPGFLDALQSHRPAECVGGCVHPCREPRPTSADRRWFDAPPHL
jgi:hypothetical protein